MKTAYYIYLCDSYMNPFKSPELEALYDKDYLKSYDILKKTYRRRFWYGFIFGTSVQLIARLFT